MGDRPDPFAMVFGELAEARFPQIREALGEDRSIFDRDALVLTKPMVELLRELRPDEGIGEGIEELVALAHLAYAYWLYGERVVSCGPETLAGAIDGGVSESDGATGETAYYVQLPSRKLWGAPVDEQPPEPLDGWFAGRERDRLWVVAVFGLHEQRHGFIVVEVVGPAPRMGGRADGAVLFGSVLEGGAKAGLHSITTMSELLELAWRVDRIVAVHPEGTRRMVLP